MCIEVSNRRSPWGSDSIERLKRFYARELGVSENLLARPGVHMISHPRRERESWCGYGLPLLMLQRDGGAVVSVEEALLPDAERIVGARAGELDAETVDWLLGIARSAHSGAKELSGYALYCEPVDFRPRAGAPVERLTPDAPEWGEMRKHFDGPVFVSRAADGHVASWAAVKLKDPRVWEIAVTTEEPYRGRGLGKLVVSAAARYILESGRTPLYVHDAPNVASARVARALGFTEFARAAYVSVGRPGATGMW